MRLINICNNCQLVTAAGMANRAHVVFSYGMPVFAVDCSGMTPRFVRLWDGWSVTTQRHINKALDALGHSPAEHINKAKWEKDVFCLT